MKSFSVELSSPDSRKRVIAQISKLDPEAEFTGSGKKIKVKTKLSMHKVGNIPGVKDVLMESARQSLIRSASIIDRIDLFLEENEKSLENGEDLDIERLKDIKEEVASLLEEFQTIIAPKKKYEENFENSKSTIITDLSSIISELGDGSEEEFFEPELGGKPEEQDNEENNEDDDKESM